MDLKLICCNFRQFLIVRSCCAIYTVQIDVGDRKSEIAYLIENRNSVLRPLLSTRSWNQRITIVDRGRGEAMAAMTTASLVSLYEPESPSRTESRLVRLLGLSPIISALTAVSLLSTAFLSISFLVFLNSSQAFVLSEILGLEERVGKLTGTLIFGDECVSLIMVLVWGVCCDEIGVREVAVSTLLFSRISFTDSLGQVLGNFIIAIAFFLFPNAPSFEVLFATRLFYAVSHLSFHLETASVLPRAISDFCSKLVTSSERVLSSLLSPQDYPSSPHRLPPRNQSSAPQPNRLPNKSPPKLKDAISKNPFQPMRELHY